jgi:hypothetical protein
VYPLAAAVLAASPAFAVDLIDVLPASMGQPQINVAVFAGNNPYPQTGVQAVDIDPTTGDLIYAPYFTIPAYFDTGASGILISVPQAQQLNIPTTTNIFNDVGVGGSDQFNISQSLRLALADYYPRTDLDQFDAASHPILTGYTPINTSPIYAEVGPAGNDVSTDPIDQLINELNAIDVVGTPAMAGHVIVMNPSHVNDFFTVYNAILNDPNADLTALASADIDIHTNVCNPGTPFHPATADTNPGIPATTHHIKLSYASFNRFTSVSPSGVIGPTLNHNPFIGDDPVAVFDGHPNPNAPPGIKISRSVLLPGQTTPTLFTSEGNWLLDTGAASSMISIAQAANLHVYYQSPPSSTNDNPVLIDDQGNPLPDQFTLAITGVGGTINVAGFYLDSLLLRTMEGSAIDDNNPHNIRFLHAPVLVSNVSMQDPVSGKILTLDGIFGMNYLVASADLSVDPTGLPTFNSFSTSYFNWFTFDEPNGILGLSFAPTELVWNGANGKWSDISQWSNAGSAASVSPNNGPTDSDVYSATINGGVVTLDTNATIQSLNFTAGTLTGTANLTLTSGIVNGTYNLTGLTTIAGGTLLFNTGTHNAGAFTGTGNLEIAPGVVLTSDAVTLGGSWTINGTHILRPHASTAGTSKVGGLTLGAAGKLDITNNSLIVETTASTKSAMLAALKSNLAAGATGSVGLTSSTTIADPAHKTTVIVDNALLNLTQFSGQPVDANSLLIESTYFGDSNLDRKVDVTDLGTLATNYGKVVPNGILQGDFNGDGKVDVTDLGLLATDYGLGTSGSPFSVLSPQSSSLASVPEPATLLSLIPLATCLLRRNRPKRPNNPF